MKTHTDKYGTYAKLVVTNPDNVALRFRFRWIPPGRFLMGSPEGEVKRSNDEGPQHEVRISQGFWLMDTPVTQALWVEVMDDNPSRFKGDPRRPVEQVSWDDAMRFIERLNGMIPDFDLVLPTEAQWEYACRAGTTTPFWCGLSIYTDQANYDGRYPYADNVPKGEYRGKTVIINFWTTWCPPCREEIPSMNRMWNDLQDEDVVILAINIGEDDETIFVFTANYPADFPLLLDREGEVIAQWPVKGLPTTYVVAPDGRITYRAIGARNWDDPEFLARIRALREQ